MELEILIFLYISMTFPTNDSKRGIIERFGQKLLSLYYLKASLYYGTTFYLKEKTTVTNTEKIHIKLKWADSSRFDLTQVTTETQHAQSFELHSKTSKATRTKTHPGSLGVPHIPITQLQWGRAQVFPH